MKKISVLIPCYNEEENVVPISEAVIGIITKELPQYDYELVFIDNDSTDKTRELLRMLCAKNPKIALIFGFFAQSMRSSSLREESEDQGDLQREKLWTVQFSVLWNPSGNR